MLIAFWILAFITIGAAIMVVTLKNLVHCAFFLVLAFSGVAGIFILLDAEFLAVVQILIYIGAVTVLLLFAIMLTYKVTDKSIRQVNKQAIPSLLIVGAAFLLLCVALSRLPPAFAQKTIPKDFTAILGKQLLSHYLLPFELASIVLLVAIIGAIILARRE